MKKFRLKTLLKTPTDKELLKLWREVCLLKAGNRCEYPGCNKTEHLNAHHFYSRSRTSTRYDSSNSICLCSGHHSLNQNSAHKDPMFKDIILSEGVRTLRWLETLERRAKTPAKVDKNLELLALKKELSFYEQDKLCNLKLI